LEAIAVIRLTLMLAVWMSLVSVASASLAPRREPRLGLDSVATTLSKRLATPTQPAAAQAPPTDFVLTHETEVLLDGKPCRYEEVPAHARIVRMEVAADRKTVLKVHFRSGK
jgi:hypothetical protein